MASKPEAPVDELTHFSLPFVPDPDLPPMPPWGEWSYDRRVANFHHSIFKRAEVESLGAGGQAARDARIQWTWTATHQRFHEEWGGLTEHLPRTAPQQLRTVLFGLMRYVPEKGISFARPTPQVITLRARDRQLLGSGGQLMLANNGNRARNFLLDHSFEVGGPQADPHLIEMFLALAKRPNTRPSRLLALGDAIMHQTIEPTLTPGLRDMYAYARGNNMLRPGLPRGLRPIIRREIISAFTKPQELIATLVDKCAVLGPKVGIAATAGATGQ